MWVRHRSKLNLPGTLLFLFLLVIFFMVKAQGLVPNGTKFSLTILHTNDLHAHDEPFMERGRSIGGLARIAHLIKILRAKVPNVLVLDAGDYFQGTTMFQKYGGEVEVNLLNMAGYDVATIGNHEFDNGPQNLYQRLVNAKFSVVSCNLDCQKDAQLESIVKPFVIKDIANQKIAIIGVITPELEKIDLNLDPIRLKKSGSDWMQPIVEAVETCKQAGTNKVILVSHCGLECDRQMAQNIPDIDVIIGGHSHTRLKEPIWVDHSDERKTVIVQTGCYGRSLGELQVIFDQVGNLIESECHYKLLNVTANIQEDPFVAAYLATKAIPLLKLKQEIVGYAEGDFDNHFSNFTSDSPLGDLICDALFEAGSKYGVTIVFHNRGGIRARIDKGPISEEKIQEVLPFDNKLVLATINGAAIKQAVEHSLAGGLGGSFLEVHGLKIGYDRNQPIGQRAKYILVQSNSRGKPSWSPLLPNEDYKIAVNDYTFKGGEGYDFSQAKNIVHSADRMSVVLHNYLIERASVCPRSSQRLISLVPIRRTKNGYK